MEGGGGKISVFVPFNARSDPTQYLPPRSASDTRWSVCGLSRMEVEVIFLRVDADLKFIVKAFC